MIAELEALNWEEVFKDRVSINERYNVFCDVIMQKEARFVPKKIFKKSPTKRSRYQSK